MRRNLALMLEMEGFQVVTAENGRTGLEVARSLRPDLIICDVMMPELDGFAVLQTLRGEEAGRTVPFIFLTARGGAADVRVGMNFGADDYLCKPVVREDLLAAVHARLERATALAQTLGSAAFNPDFSSPEPLRTAFGLTHREAEVLLWTAQGKSNADIGCILSMAEKTVKQHLGSVFQKLGVEGRNAATVRALEILATRRHPAAG